MFKKIANNEELPPPEKLKPLRDAFIRTLNVLRTKTTIRQQDLALVFQYTDASGLDIARPLAATARYLREKKHLTRREVSRLSGFPVRWLIALERGQIQDLSLPEFARLSKGLGLDTCGIYERAREEIEFKTLTVLGAGFRWLNLCQNPARTQFFFCLF
jgi:transcriptional regulator with XRE-family HTH domain